MFFNFIKSVVNYKYNSTVEPRIRDGKYTLVNECRATLSVGGEQYNTNLFSQTDYQVCGWKPSSRTVEAEHNFLGYNKRFITEAGTYDFLTAVEDFSKHTTGQRLTRQEIASLAETNVYADTHEAFIYNMLVSWYMAKLYVDTSSTDRVLKVNQTGYRDSHVGIEIGGVLGDRSVEIELGCPNLVTFASSTWTFRDSVNYWSRPYVLRYNATTDAQGVFYMMHTTGRRGTSPLNADVPIQPLDPETVLLDPIGGRHAINVSEDEVPWDKPAIVWGYIIDYVTTNRLQHAFSAALELLGTVSSQPLPSFQESIQWCNMQQIVSLSAFSPTRGRVRSNFDGEPLALSTLAHDFIINEGAHPANFLFASSLMNYYFWVGLQSLVDNFSRSLSDWKNVFLFNHDELSVLSTTHAHSAMISVATGKSVPTCMNNCAFIVYNLAPMFNITSIVADVLYEEGYPELIPVKGIHPYVSGSLIMGSVTGDLMAKQHLTALQTFSIDEYGELGMESATIAANAYRLFGHQLDLTNSRSGVKLSYHAPVRECVIDYSTMYERVMHYDKVMVNASFNREGRFSELPNARTLRDRSIVTLSITKPNIDLVSWQQPHIKSGITTVLPSRRKPVMFTVTPGYSFKTVIARAKHHPIITESDFHEATTHITPEQPTITPDPPLSVEQSASHVDMTMASPLAHETSVSGVV